MDIFGSLGNNIILVPQSRDQVNIVYHDNIWQISQKEDWQRTNL